MTLELDDIGREAEIKAAILAKPALRDWYQGVYRRWAAALATAPAGGLAVEIGAGAGFAGELIPGLLRTDALAYPGIDQVADALAMPWGAGELRAIFMLNVLHHLPDAARFLAEAQRVLKPGGLLVLTDPHIGFLSRGIYTWLHHEPIDVAAQGWATPVDHPLAGANSALAWIVFRRDLARFQSEFPALELLAYERFSPLQYWLSGGLKRWTLVPGFALPLARALDRMLAGLLPDSASFCHVIVRRRNPA